MKTIFSFTGGVRGRAPKKGVKPLNIETEQDLFSAPCQSERAELATLVSGAPCQFNKKMPEFLSNNENYAFSISDNDLEFCKNKLALQAIWLQSQKFESEITGEIRSLFDFTMSANLSKKYYAEVYNRANTITDFMLNNDHRVAFLTITLNGCWRDALRGDYSRFSENEYKGLSREFKEYLKLKIVNNEPLSIRDLVNVLNCQWHGFFKRVLGYFQYYKFKKYFYIRAFEPHKNGVPHIHALISYPILCHDNILKAFKYIFNAPQNLKSNYLSKEQKENGEINGFQWTLSNPTGYVLKYINKSFVNCLENEELNKQQAWYIKYKVRRFTTSRHQIPLWIYRKINFFKKDFYDLCNLVNSDDWYCEWDYNNKYFRFSNIKTDELITWEGGILEHSMKGVIIHRYAKKVYKPNS